ncbi:hypothetical protein FGO68_gene12074 [Halteria grandinella]|uniref:Uncharacterized protein n=1 Tax=Halteria grandinella TaxID=5974 RepID=A0A8J8NYL8_HALGN|nr:hypothetical protein FGO68_gene12074 [Halteria grandinella]
MIGINSMQNNINYPRHRQRNEIILEFYIGQLIIELFVFHIKLTWLTFKLAYYLIKRSLKAILIAICLLAYLMEVVAGFLCKIFRSLNEGLNQLQQQV